MFVYKRRLHQVIQLFLDGLSFWPAWWIAVHLRLALDPITARKLTSSHISDWLPPLWIILVVSLGLALKLNLFKLPRELKPLDIVSWAGEVTLVICAVTVLTTFFSVQVGASVSRLFVVCMAPVMLLILTANRYLALLVVFIAERNTHPPRIALLGNSSAASRLLESMGSNIAATIRGVILPEGQPLTSVQGNAAGDDELPVLGTTRQLAELVNRERLDRVIVINDAVPEPELMRCTNVMWRMGLPVSSTLSFAAVNGAHPQSSSMISKVELANLLGLPVVDMHSRQYAQMQDVSKRIFDLVGSLLLLALMGPLMIVIALLVKFTSPGPILEEARRVGFGGRHFFCFKFRTTYKDLNQPPPVLEWETFGHGDEHDATPLGLFLRRYSLDELPQFFNILRGEMSLVGPRPLPAQYLGPDGMSQKFGEWSEARACVHPGLTGIWQISGRSALAFDKMIDFDLQYVRGRSFWLDLSILLKTPLVVFRGLGG